MNQIELKNRISEILKAKTYLEAPLRHEILALLINVANEHADTKTDRDIRVKGDILFQFFSYSDWVNKAEYLYKVNRTSRMHTIALDRNGDVCHMGEDFMVARELALYPVKVYSLQRSKH